MFGFLFLLCSSLCPFLLRNHLAEEERTGCFTVMSSCCHMAVNYVYLIHGSVKWSLLLDDSHEISCLIFVEN